MNPIHDSIMAARAWSLASHWHDGQMYGDKPYTKHLMDALNVLSRFGYAGNSVLYAATALHDILEDTDATVFTLEDADISRVVIKIVEAVTDPEGFDTRAERKAIAYREIAFAGRRATIVKLADRIANVEAGGKIDMYRKEHPAFRAALYNPDHDLDAMWDHLDGLLGPDRLHAMRVADERNGGYVNEQL